MRLSIEIAESQHHYIFFIAGEQPIIVAVLHEKMDFISRLENRLNEE